MTNRNDRYGRFRRFKPTEIDSLYTPKSPDSVWISWDLCPVRAFLRLPAIRTLLTGQSPPEICICWCWQSETNTDFHVQCEMESACGDSGQLMNTYQDIVTETLDSLTTELRGYVVTQLQASFQDDWLKTARNSFRNDRTVTKLSDDVAEWDAHALLTIMWDHWNAAFRSKLGLFERSLVAELRAFRNRWAHQRSFNFDDTYRLLDSTQRLLSAIGAGNQTAISELKFQLLRDEFGESINAAARNAENNRERWVVASVYSMCGGVLVYLMFKNFGSDAWPMGLSLTLLFLFLIWKRVSQKAITIGPRECRRCHRIIYGTTCPYCPGGSGFDSNEFRISDTESPEVETQKQAST